jgi:hypothetical protein
VCGTGYWTKGATIGATIYGRWTVNED